jgi:hypothetical protein
MQGIALTQRITVFGVEDCKLNYDTYFAVDSKYVKVYTNIVMGE